MKTPSVQQARSRLESNTIELRKRKRTEQQLRRRVQAPELDYVFDLSLLSIEPRLGEPNQNPIDLLKLLFGVLEIQPPEDQLQVCLSCIQSIIGNFTDEYALLHDADLRPLYVLSCRYLQAYLDCSNFPPEIVYEASMILCNLTHSFQGFCEVFIEQDGVEVLIRALDVCEVRALESLIVTIGNISSYGRDLAAQFIAKGFLKTILFRLQGCDRTQSWLKQTGWAVSILIRYIEIRADENFYDVIEIFSNLKDLDDQKSNDDILWGCVRLTSSDDDCLLAFSKSSLLAFVFRQLKQSSVKSDISVVRTAGNLVSGSSYVTQQMLDLGLAELLVSYLTFPNEKLAKEAMWAFSNIAIDSPQNAMRIFKHSIVPHAVRALWSKDGPLAKEASHLLINLAATLPSSSVERLHTEFKIFQIAGQRPEALDPDVLLNILLALRTFLTRVEPFQLSSILDSLDADGWTHTLELVQHHENQNIYGACAVILKEFFDAEDEAFQFS